MSDKKSLPIAVGITAGDAAGIGTEIIIKSLSSKFERRDSRYVVYCRKDIFERAYKLFAGSFEYETAADSDFSRNSKHTITLVDPIGGKGSPVEFGKVSAEHADNAMKYIETAARDAMRGSIDAIVTAPINKLGVHAAGYKEKGHTEFITGIVGVYDYAMMFVGGGLRVVLLTMHLPLKDVPSMVTRNAVLKKIQLTDTSLRNWFGIAKPRIAVCGLNPHGGENGVLGDEDRMEILPAVEDAVRNGIPAFGPMSADSVFHRCRHGEYDAVIAMYHDQGLIPVKALAFGKGVNITIGMPFIRTSPDHGTAYDIAGKGIADTGSITEAIKLAIELTENRRRLET